MKSRLWICLLGLICLILTSLTAYAGESTKKGIGLWTFDGAEKGLKNLGVSWYYNWTTDTSLAVDSKIKFIPMISNEKFVTAIDFKKAKAYGEILLSFNEPDDRKQADMPVELALKLWPQLEATGMRLGSPATASGADDPNSWLGQFMQQSITRSFRVDFICVHRYESSYSDPVEASRRLEQFLRRVHELYDRPVWLTEFALANWQVPANLDQQRIYMEAVLPILEKLPFLERYAWFALPPNPGGDGGALAGSSLSDNKGDLNALGDFYQKHQPQPDTQAGSNKSDTRDGK